VYCDSNSANAWRRTHSMASASCATARRTIDEVFKGCPIQRLQHGTRAIAHAHFRQGPGDIVLHRAFRDGQRVRDLAIEARDRQPVAGLTQQERFLREQDEQGQAGQAHSHRSRVAQERPCLGGHVLAILRPPARCQWSPESRATVRSRQDGSHFHRVRQGEESIRAEIETGGGHQR
jgi:hypothetical protein